MANRTLTQATSLAGVDIASNDELWIWDVTAAALRKCTRADLIGGVITGGGTVATGGFTLTVPATGTAALLTQTNVFTVSQSIASLSTGLIYNLADNAATSFEPYGAGGLLMFSPVNAVGATAFRNQAMAIVAYVKSASTPSIAIMTQPATRVSVSTGTLSGTTGTDDSLNISIHTDNNLYIENRLGGVVSLRYTIFA